MAVKNEILRNNLVMILIFIVNGGKLMEKVLYGKDNAWKYSFMLSYSDVYGYRLMRLASLKCRVKMLY